MTQARSVQQYPHFLASEIDQPDPQQARFHVLPIPFEHSTSYGGGTAHGPSAILQASLQLEVWDGHGRPADQGIYTHPAVDCTGTPEAVMANIAQATGQILNCGGIPVSIGGEHTVTWGVIQGLLQAGISDFGVVQIDAHADLRDRYEGNPLSHASVMRRVVEAGIPLFQLGVRALCEEEIAVRKAEGVAFLDAEQLIPHRITDLTLPDNFPSKVYFTLDIDGMDPSVFPATGTPVPGGLDWYQTLSLFESVARQRQMIGFDLVEFAPIEGFHAYDFAAAQLLYKLMGICDRAGQ